MDRLRNPVNTQVRLEKEDYDALRARLVTEGISFSEWTRRMIRAHLKYADSIRLNHL